MTPGEQKSSHYLTDYELHIQRDKTMYLINKATKRPIPVWKTMGDKRSMGIFVWPNVKGAGVCYLMEDEIVREE